MQAESSKISAQVGVLFFFFLSYMKAVSSLVLAHITPRQCLVGEETRKRVPELQRVLDLFPHSIPKTLVQRREEGESVFCI